MPLPAEMHPASRWVTTRCRVWLTEGDRVWDRSEAEIQFLRQHFDVQSLAGKEGLVKDAFAKDGENAVAGAFPFTFVSFTRLASLPIEPEWALRKPSYTGNMSSE